MSWQVQDAKQRFSEVLRAAEQGGPQIITRHGEEVAVIIDIAEYRRLTGPKRDFAEHVMAFPKLCGTADEPDVFAEIEAERQQDVPREIDLGIGE
ncbi:MAG TPA: type II toxin-antitoxin system Phd/YefM family antitoxin [Pseudonocardiaceae bacterium]|nr:type II toxin-antitoxin system Phd/YefM family antitoxin [Pseudonocardiaceae bacterium]